MAAALITAGTLTACGGNTSGAQAEPGTWAKSSGTIVFGAGPDQAGSDSNNKPLEDYIAKQTGYKVEYYPTSDYTALIAAAVAGKVDMMSSGALQYVTAVNKGAKLEPVAATLSSSKVKDPGYYSEAIVPGGSPITSLAGAKGKKVCFVEDSVVDPAAAKGDVTVIGKQYVPGGPLAISTTLPADVQTKLTGVLQGATLDAIKGSGVTLTDGFTKGFFGAQKVDASYYKSITDLCTSIPSAKCSK